MLQLKIAVTHGKTDHNPTSYNAGVSTVYIILVILSRTGSILSNKLANLFSVVIGRVKNRNSSLDCTQNKRI